VAGVARASREEAELMRLKRTPARIDVTGETLERLPPELEAFVRAAIDGEFPDGIVNCEDGSIVRIRQYVTAWAAEYLTGNPDDALEQLGIVYQAAQVQLGQRLN
jgi:hypothetical protein